jgi:hypothetical protein
VRGTATVTGVYDQAVTVTGVGIGVFGKEEGEERAEEGVIDADREEEEDTVKEEDEG